ncbi:hypothetical protein N9B55_00240 [Vicingaceae bacterium]|nr:hypothetical protein [Vicingaceae bacterium]
MNRLKSIAIILTSFFLSFSVLAQDTTKYFLPKAGDFGASIVVNGLINNINLSTNNNTYGQNILFAKYYLKDDLALRTGLGFKLNRTLRESADSAGALLVEVDSLRRSFSVNVSIGIEKHLTANKRLDPFVFGQLDISMIGKSRNEIENRQTSTFGTASTEREIIRDGGFALGLNLGGGFNYFLAKNFSAGTELYLGFQYVSVGGGITDNTTNTTAGGTRMSTFDSRDDISKTTVLNVNPTAQINFSYFF